MARLMADWVRQGSVRRRKAVVLDGNGAGSVTFGVDFSANHKWEIADIIVSTSQSSTTPPYPTATVYLGGQQAGVSEGATWTGNQDVLRGQMTMTLEELTVAFTGGLAGSTATVAIEGESFLWR